MFERIFEKGMIHNFESNHMLFLQDPDTMWFLEKGSINLFIIEFIDGTPQGMRRFLATFQAPALLFPFQNNDDRVTAITESPSILWQIPVQELDAIIGEYPNLLTQWINRLSLFYNNEMIFSADHYLAPHSMGSLQDKETLATQRAVHHTEKDRIGWVEVAEGEVRFLGKVAQVLPQAPFPLTYNGWIQSVGKSTLLEVGAPLDWRGALYHFHRLLLEYARVIKKEKEGEERDRIQKRLNLEEHSIDAALKELAAVVIPKKIERLPLGGWHQNNKLFLTCRAVAQDSNISLTPPLVFSDTSSLEKRVAEIAEASKIHFRKVRLRGRWWKQDSGPLLGFYGPQNDPVALFPQKNGGYIQFDSVTQNSRLVTKKESKEFAAHAYMFYPSLPATIKKGSDVFNFFWRGNRKEFFPIALFSVLASLLALFTPFATANLMNLAIPEANGSLLLQLTIGLFAAAISSSLFIFFRSLYVTRVEGKAGNTLQNAIWDRILKLPVSFFRKYTTGNLIQRINAVEKTRALMSDNALNIIFSLFYSLINLLAMFLYAPALAIIAAICLAGNITFTFFCVLAFSRLETSYYEYQGKLNAFVIQLISAVGRLRASGAENNAFAKWAHLFAQAQKISLRSIFYSNEGGAISFLFPYIMFLMIFGYILMGHGDYTIGSYLAFSTSLVIFYQSITSLSNALFAITPVYPLWKRTEVIVKEPLEEESKVEDPGSLRGEVQIDDLFFKYDESENYALQNINLKANPKEFIGIVGPSGCGKSTLIRLLLGFEKPQTGAIYFDDKDIASLSKNAFRKQLGVVLQNEGIISGSIFDNLTCGGSYSPEAIERALFISGFAEDADSLPMGLNTYLSTGGLTMSGGQRQRLLIARALLPNPKILILDEATSALDNRNQKKVIESIDQLDVTRIVIAHRLSTVRNADRIYVMENGQFTQVGTFEELAAAPGLFSKMLQRQNL